MTSLSNDLRRVLAGHIQSASAADIIAIASTLCANEAQPENLAFGSACARPAHFEVAGDVVNDARTGLVWSRENVAGAQMKWKEAQKACAAMTLGGHTDWRLPTIRELLSLVDYEKNGPAIDPAFKCESAAYWTSTPYAPSPGGYAWVVDFGGGGSGWGGQSYEYFVRAVRAGQLIGNWGW